MTFIKHISTAQTDEELVQSYQATGDMEVLAELYQRYMDLVYGVCLKYLEDKEDARDAVLNIFEELVPKLKKHDVTFFKAWLYQLAKNHCLMLLRRKKSGPVYVDAEFVQLGDNMHLEDVMFKESQLVHLQDCIGQLASQQKQSIELFYLKGQCYKEIAESTGIELNKIKSFIQNGRRNLKICMDKKAIEQAS